MIGNGGLKKIQNDECELTSPRRINLTRTETSRGGLTLGELIDRLEFISLADRCV